MKNKSNKQKACDLAGFNCFGKLTPLPSPPVPPSQTSQSATFRGFTYWAKELLSGGVTEYRIAEFQSFTVKFQSFMVTMLQSC